MTRDNEDRSQSGGRAASADRCAAEAAEKEEAASAGAVNAGASLGVFPI